MATKKSSPKAAATAKTEKSTMIKIAETIGDVAGELSVRTEQFTGMASNAFEALKSKIRDITAPKEAAIKQAAKPTTVKAEIKNKIKAVEKKLDKKIVQPASKQTAALKKEVKVIAKKINKRVVSPATKKTAAAKKVAPTKKAAKKGSKKK